MTAPKMTAAHLQQVNDAAFALRETVPTTDLLGKAWKDGLPEMLARLSEVAAHLAAQIRENDDE